MKVKSFKTIELMVTPRELRRLADQIERKCQNYPVWAIKMLRMWKLRLGSHDGLIVYIKPDLLEMDLQELALMPPVETKESER